MAEDKENKNKAENKAAQYKLFKEQQRANAEQSGSLGRIENLLQKNLVHLTKLADDTKKKEDTKPLMKELIGGIKSLQPKQKRDILRSDDIDPRENLKVLKSIKDLLSEKQKENDKSKGILGSLLSAGTGLLGMVTKGGLLFRAASSLLGLVSPSGLLLRGASALFNLFTKGGLMFRAGTALLNFASSPMIQGLAKGAGGLMKGALMRLAPHLVSMMPVLLPAILTGAAIYKIKEHLDKRKIEKSETAESVQKAMGDPSKRIKIRQDDKRFTSLKTKRLIDYEDQDILVAAQEATAGFSTGKKRALKRSALIKEMTEKRDEARAAKKSIVKARRKKALKDVSLNDRMGFKFDENIAVVSDADIREYLKSGNVYEPGELPGEALNGSGTLQIKEGANIENIKWSQIGGYDYVSSVINNAFQKAGIQGAPVITSGYRTEGENRSVGGKKGSKHVLGQAIDLRIPNDPENKLKGFLRAAFPQGQYGLLRHSVGGGDHYHIQWPGPGYKIEDVKPPVFAANGMILNGNRSVVAGEAGPEAIIPLNEQGKRFMVDALSQTQDIPNVNFASKDAADAAKMSQFMSFLQNAFTNTMAKAIADNIDANDKKKPKKSPTSGPGVDIY